MCNYVVIYLRCNLFTWVEYLYLYFNAWGKVSKASGNYVGRVRYIYKYFTIVNKLRINKLRVNLDYVVIYLREWSICIGVFGAVTLVLEYKYFTIVNKLRVKNSLFNLVTGSFPKKNTL